MTTQQIQPQAGDAVFCINGSQIGRLATIDGVIGKKPDCGEYFVCFTGRSYRTETHVSSSGGPVPLIAPEDLIFTGKTITRDFWDFRNGVGAGMGVDYQLDVNLWYWKGENCNHYMRAHNFSIEKKKHRTNKCNHLIQSLIKESGIISSTLNANKLDDIYLLRGGFKVDENRCSEFSIGRCPTRDSVGIAVLEAYRLFQKFTLNYPKPLNGEKPYCFAYCETLGSGNKIIFNNKQELDNFISAYKIKIDSKKGGWGKTLLIPNNKVKSWKPLVAVKAAHRQEG
ncbi:hypothetical protein [Aliivibrio fischeri]|uniref:hypothetical protein n=1 Tax=Aliivibrio fischeri TaxID=668 RepID=UPI0007C45CF2|nr:hypothetical protein [Aliivibrio fischeri]